MLLSLLCSNTFLISSFTCKLPCIILNYVVFQVDVEKLARFLPLHLIAVLISSGRDEESFRYLLRGIRLLHSLLDLTSRHIKLEQVSFTGPC